MSQESRARDASRDPAPCIRCLVVEDRALFLQWILALLQTRPDIRIVATATSLAEAAIALEREKVDLIVVDVRLPDGTVQECLRIAQETSPNVRCVALCGSGAESCTEETGAMGGAAVMRTGGTATAFLGAVYRAIAMIRGPETPVPATWLLEPVRLLSRREYEIFCGIGRGLANKQIASALGLSPKTVETHRKSLARKLGTSGADLVRKATIHGMVATPAQENGDCPLLGMAVP